MNTNHSLYWASFKSVGENKFRLDTRIYVSPILKPALTDVCIGAVIGKNPGSAQASLPTSKGPQAIDLKGDKLLPTVRNVVLAAYLHAGKVAPDRGYIQVLNLFYLCDKKLALDLKAISKNAKPPLCPTETMSFPWVWYLWGSPRKKLDSFKVRFESIDARHPFFMWIQS